MANYPYRHKETIEICKKQEGSLGSLYYTATFLAAIGGSRCLVHYETRFSDDRTRYLTEDLDVEDVRPLPPSIPFSYFSVSDRVDAYLNDAWWSGKIARKGYPNYCVKLDGNGNEVHVAFYKVRYHLDWRDGRWTYPGNGPQNDDNQANTGVRARTIVWDSATGHFILGPFGEN